MMDSSDTDTSAKPQKRTFDRVRLTSLIDMDSPETVHKEVLHIVSLINPQFDVKPIHRIFQYTIDLYTGQLDEYRACNTDYHNLRHITDTYLAMARLLHGAQITDQNLGERDISLGLTGSLLHDTGLIQEASDTEGTGAKYTQDHVKLSMDFVEKHAATLQLESQEVKDLRDIILCTDLQADIPAISFSSPKTELLGKMLATADLIAQMADHTYLEKLLFLFHEFREGEIGDFKNEVDFLNHTLNFYEVSDRRFKITLEDICAYMAPHFKTRWGISENLYTRSLENQRKFLEKIMADKNKSIYRELKRENIVHEVRRKFGNTGVDE